MREQGIAEEHELHVEVVPEPLEGQTIHEVELPAELEAIEDGADLMRALSGYRISAGRQNSFDADWRLAERLSVLLLAFGEQGYLRL
jgi:hypothetical protein